MYDMHNHTNHSHDAQSDIFELCEKACEKGLLGIAITDHCDNEFCGWMDVIRPIRDSVAAVYEARERYQGRLKICSGVEIGEGIWFPDSAKKVLAAEEYDVVLGSVHAVRYPNFTIPYAQLNFSKFTRQQLEEFMDIYFDDMLEMIQNMDFDILTHLTCPLRYITGKYGIEMSLKPYREKIDRIFREIIDRSIAFEVNTASLGTNYNVLVPEVEFIRRYHELGGKLITVGSDSHMVCNVGKGFNFTRNTLKEIGFEHGYWYEKRKPMAYKL